MAKPALFALAGLMSISVWAQVKAGPGPVLTGEDSILPAETPITVRTKDAITVTTDDDKMYPATVDRDVADTKGRVMIPKGSDAKILIQKTGTSLSLNLAAVTVGGQTYALLASDPTRRSSIGVPADAVLTFQLDKPIMLLTPVK